MAFKLENRAEPIPGYRLIERLGGGGFGEVWKAEAPGGLFKAIKFVYGDIEAADEDGARAEQELKALSRVKTVHHPYILSLERYDIIDGQLIIVMELADRTLWDRFKECRAQGREGIPRAELLGYLRETAEALDLMIDQFQLQHLDIKPQNLFLVYNHVKVADFGLVKDLEGGIASVTGGVTPVYAAPETFDNWVSLYSDQYSLAIVYQELLTGKRPFSGTTVRQLVLQHLQASPDLSPLPAADRPVVARALNKNPDDRYPSCGEFVAALIAATAETVETLEIATDTPVYDRGAAQRPGATQRTVRDKLALTTPPPAAAPRTAAPPPLPAGAPPQPTAWADRPTQPSHSPRPLAAPPPTPAGPAEAGGPPGLEAGEETGEEPFDSRVSLSGTGPPRAGEPSGGSTAVREPHRKTAAKTRPDGVLLPALVVAVGSVGQAAVRQLRRQVQEAFGDVGSLPQIRYLCVDTDPAALDQATRGDETALRHNETFLARLHRASHYIKSRDDAADRWLHPKMVYRIPRQQTPAGVRALGRLAFVDNHAAIVRRLEAEVQACLDPDPLKEAMQRSGLPVVSVTPRVYVVAGLAGGTGGGMFIDLGYVAQDVLRRAGFANPEVVGVFLVPKDAHRPDQRADLANAYAALTELQHFASDRNRFSARYARDAGQPGAVLSESGPPFQRCVLVPAEPEDTCPAAPDAPGEAAAPSVAQAAGALFVDLCTPAGRKAEAARQQWAKVHCRGGARPALFQTAAVYRILWPRKQLLRKAARLFCKSLAEQWMSKDAKLLKDGVRDWVEQHWGEFRLGPNEMIERCREACEKALGRPTEAALDAVLDPIAAIVVPITNPQNRAGRGTPLPEVKLPLATVLEAVEGLEALLGFPDNCQSLTGPRPSGGADTGAVGQALRQFSSRLGKDCEAKLAHLAVRLIEQPEFRLAGAEEAVRQFARIVEQALGYQEPLAQEYQDRAAALHGQLQAMLDSHEKLPDGESGWRLTFSKKTTADNHQFARSLLELLRAYSKARYQSLVLHRIHSFYLSLRGQLSDQLRELDFCRQRLREIAAHFDDAPEPAGQKAQRKRKPALIQGGCGRLLLPDRCRHVAEAVALLEKRVTTDDFRALDQQIQAMIQKQFRALVHVCMTSSSVLRGFLPAMQAEAEAFLDARLEAQGVVDMYLAAHGTVDPDDSEGVRKSIEDDVLDAYAEATPPLAGGNPEDEVCVVAIPPGPGQPKLQEITRDALRDVIVYYAESSDEIVVYREHWQTEVPTPKQLHRQGREAYEELARNELGLPHSRIDVPRWEPLPS